MVAVETEIDYLIEKVHSLLPETLKVNSLYNGNTGLLAYYLYTYRYTNDEKWAEKASDLLSHIFDEIKSGNSTYTFKSPLSFGSSGLGLVLHLAIEDEIMDNDFENLFLEFDTIAFEGASKHIIEDNPDPLHGAIGSMYYLIQRTTDNPETVVYLEKLVEALYTQAIKDEKGVRFLNKHLEKFQSHQKFNFGYAHGLSGILMVLSKIYEKGIAQELCKEMIYEGTRYMLSYKTAPDFEQKKYSFLPLSTDEEIAWNHPDNYKEYGGRLGWCYGDLSQMFYLYSIGKLFNNNDWINIADEIGAVVVKRKIFDDTWISASQFCHGSAGLVYLFRKTYLLTGNYNYKLSSEYWLEKTINKFEKELDDENNINLRADILEGFIGVSLVLQAEKYGIDYYWDKMFLLS